MIYVSRYILILRNRDQGDELSDRKYRFGRPWGRLISSHYMKYTLDLSQLLVSCTLAELS